LQKAEKEHDDKGQSS